MRSRMRQVLVILHISGQQSSVYGKGLELALTPYRSPIPNSCI